MIFSAVKPLEVWIKRLPRHFLVAAGIVSLLFLLDTTGIIDLRERDTYDFRSRLRPFEQPHRDLVLVEIDDTSLSLLGTWPWRRYLHAELIRALTEAGAQTIFFDILFPEKSNYPEDDAVFSEAIQKAGNVILPLYFTGNSAKSFVYPLEELMRNSRGIGYANTLPDSDGVVRGVIPSISANGKTYYHSAVATFLSLFTREEEALDWVNQNLSRFHNKKMLIHYPSKLDRFQMFFAGDVLSKAKTEQGRSELRQFFNRKVVMFGDVSTGSSDILTTPIQALTPGLRIQASIFNMLKTGRFLNELPKAVNYGIVFLLSWIAAFAGARLQPQKALIAILIITALFVAVNLVVFYYGLTVIYFSTPLIAVIIVFVLSLFLKYVDVRVESDFLERELQMASKIQQSLLPGTELKLTQLDAGFRCLFYEQVGGDLYDWMDLGNGRVALCLGDVSGKGVPAALYMSRALNELRHQVTSGASPGEILTELNNHLSRGETSGMFLTLFFLIIDLHGKKIYFSNGGHDPMVYYHAKNNKAELITSAGGLPVGIMEDQAYETGEIEFNAGDVLLLTSDGIKEQKSPRGEQYGSERLQQILERCAKGENAAKMIDAVMADVLGFASGRPPHDDRTLVCVKILG